MIERIRELAESVESAPYGFVVDRALLSKIECAVPQNLREPSPIDSLLGQPLAPDKALHAPEDHHLMIVFATAEEWAMYWGLCELNRSAYAFTKKGEPVTWTPTTIFSSTPEAPCRGESTTILFDLTAKP